jgi:SAM-dependent methyltransferase
VAGSALPFPDDSFDCVTSIEVLEHVPSAARRASLAEMCRVLTPGGRLVVRCPHAGLFSWLDGANLRYRFPNLYRKVIRRGLREDTYPAGADDIVWHHHFTQAELQSLLPANLAVDKVHFGGLFVFPLADLLCWPFYRAQRTEHFVVHALNRIADCDYGIGYGRWSYGILMVMRKE